MSILGKEGITSILAEQWAEASSERFVRECRKLSDAANSLREENEDLERQLDLLSMELVYKGNSVNHWWAKAHAYSGIVFAVCEAFRRLGYSGEMGDLVTLPERLNTFVDKLQKIAEKEDDQHQGFK